MWSKHAFKRWTKKKCAVDFDPSQRSSIAENVKETTQELNLKTSILKRIAAITLAHKHTAKPNDMLKSSKTGFFSDRKKKANFNKLTQKKNLVSRCHVDSAQLFFFIKHKIDLWYIPHISHLI